MNQFRNAIDTATGMPAGIGRWPDNDLSHVFSELGPGQYVELQKRARSLRDAAIADGARVFGRWLARLPRHVGRRVVEGRRRRALERELYGLDDRTLRDIGIPRALIPEICAAAIRDPESDPRFAEVTPANRVDTDLTPRRAAS